MELINDEWGNFVIQNIIFMKNPTFTDFILDYLIKNINILSKQKISSNVLDRVYKYNFYFLVSFI